LTLSSNRHYTKLIDDLPKQDTVLRRAIALLNMFIQLNIDKFSDIQLPHQGKNRNSFQVLLMVQEMVRLRPLPVAYEGSNKNCRTVKICRRSSRNKFWEPLVVENGSSQRRN
jgi:hypothetical protein